MWLDYIETNRKTRITEEKIYHQNLSLKDLQIELCLNELAKADTIISELRIEHELAANNYKQLEIENGRLKNEKDRIEVELNVVSGKFRASCDELKKKEVEMDKYKFGRDGDELTRLRGENKDHLKSIKDLKGTILKLEKENKNLKSRIEKKRRDKSEGKGLDKSEDMGLDKNLESKNMNLNAELNDDLKSKSLEVERLKEELGIKNRDVEKLNAELESKRRDIEKLRDELVRKSRELESKGRELEKLSKNKKYLDLKTKNEDLKGENTELKKENSELKKENSELKNEISKLKNDIFEIKHNNQDLVDDLNRKIEVLEEKVAFREKLDVEKDQLIDAQRSIIKGFRMNGASDQRLQNDYVEDKKETVVAWPNKKPKVNSKSKKVDNDAVKTKTVLTKKKDTPVLSAETKSKDEMSKRERINLSTDWESAASPTKDDFKCSEVCEFPIDGTNSLIFHTPVKKRNATKKRFSFNPTSVKKKKSSTWEEDLKGSEKESNRKNSKRKHMTPKNEDIIKKNKTESVVKNNAAKPNEIPVSESFFQHLSFSETSPVLKKDVRFRKP